MLKGKTGVVVGLAMLASISLSACGSGGGVPQAQVHKGTVPLDAIRVGTPETVFKEAMLTFVQDPAGCIGGKNQYLSRINNTDGGQYVVQAKNDLCYGIDVVHAKPVTKEVAIKTMQKLLPPNVKDVPTERAALVSKPNEPVREYAFGANYVGRVYYTDKSANEVRVVTIERIGGPAVAAAPQAQ